MTDRIPTLLNNVYATFLDLMFYPNDPVDLLDEYVSKEVMGYGTTLDEKVFGLKDLKELAILQRSQAPDLKFKFEPTTIYRKMEDGDRMAVLVDEIKITMFIEGEKVILNLRMSTVWELIEEKWMLVHWHGSKPEYDSGGIDTWHAEEWQKKNQDLQKQVEEKAAELIKKNHELEIEGALERVRTAAMAMNKPNDMVDVCKILSEQLEKLGVKHIRNVQTAVINEQKENYLNYQYYTAYKKGTIEELDYNKHTKVLEMAKEMKRSTDGFFGGSMKGKELMEFRNYRKKDNQFPDPLLDETSALYYNFYSIGKGGLGLSTYKKLSKEKLELFKRFYNVFTLAYQRFNDIQQAETQVREAQIEAALERVRARSMAMQKSRELADLSLELVKQVQALGIDTWFCAFNIYDEDGKGSLEWGSNGQGTFPKYRTPREGVFLRYYEAGQKGEKLLINEIDEKDCPRHYEYLCSLPGVGEQLLKMKADGIPFPTSQIDHVAFFKYGYILFITFKQTPDAHDIFKRFSKVFEQTYTRFLDLQKAEAQARESEIELALERVRARTMAMQHSDELADVATVLFQQVKELGIPQWTCGFNIWETGDTEFTFYPGGPDGEILPSSKVPLNEHPIFRQFDESRKRGDELFIYEKKGEVQADHYRYMHSLPGIGDMLQGMLDQGLEFPEFQIDHIANFAYGNIVFITYEPFPKMHDVFIRFAKVFEQTYTRFLDLQKAEAQAREAQIEAALERVRSRAMAIRKSEELIEVIQIIFQEMEKLGFDIMECSIVIYDINPKDFIYWTSSSGDSALPSSYKLQYIDHPVMSDLIKDLKSGVQYRSGKFSGKVLKTWWDRVFTESDFKNSPKEYIESWKKVKQLFYSQAAMSHGFLEFLGSTPLPEDKVEVLKRFTKVVDLAYTRYDDVVKAEAQAREAQIETSMERVRSRSMGMQKSEELKEVIQLIFEQLALLNIDAEHAGIVVDYEPKKDFHFWVADKQDIPSKITVPYLDLFWDKQFTEAKQKGKEFFTTLLDFEEKNNFYKELLPHIQGLTKKAKDFYFSCPGLAGSTVLEKDIGLYIENFEGIPYLEEENNILMRFGKVFQQTYTRFLDLKNSEAQAREAQIETALEKVRSQSMGMQTSEDLSKVTTVMFEQLRMLGGELYATGIVLCDKHKDHVEQWHSIPKAGMLTPFIVPIDLDKVHQYRYNQWKKGVDLFSIEIEEDFIEQHFNTLFRLPSVKVVLEDFEARGTPMPEIPSWEIDYGASFKYGYLLVSALKPFEEKHILTRFAKVFEQAYTRFLDLQKAEEQAREAQIEAVLERVRSRTMAMQQSEEMPEVANNLFLQVKELGFPAWSAGYCIWEGDTSSASCSMSSEGVIQKSFSLPTVGEGYDFLTPLKNGETFYVAELGGEELVKHYEYMLKLPVIGEIIEGFEEAGIELPTFQIFHIVFFKQGYLMFITYESVPEAHDIFKRLARVFEQTYTRFLDLQKAENRARETQIELALERIRAMVANMQKSEDLLGIMVKMRAEFVSLGHEAHYFWHMKWEPEKYLKAMTSGDGTEIGMVMELPRKIHGEIPSLAAWEKSDEPTVVHVMDVEATLDYIHKMVTWGDFKSVDPNMPTEEDIHHIGGLTYVMARTLHGEIGYSLPGMVPDPPQESLDALVRFAGVFDLAYRRFEDLKSAELRNRETQIELALERSRNQSMLMNHSDELNQTSKVFHEQLDLLGIESEFSYLWLPDEDKMEHLFWASWHENNKGDEIFTNKEVTYPLDKTEPSIAACYVAWESGERVHINPVSPDEVKDYFATWDELLHGVEKFKPELFPEGIYYVDAYMKYGCFGIMIKRLITEEEKKILSRFAVEFERAYTRFLDLKKSEAQTREAQIEAALERVRSKTMAMHNSEDVGATVCTLFDEVLKLGLDESIRIGIGILEGHEGMETWSVNSKSDGNVDLKMGMLDMTIHPMLIGLKKAWKSGKTNYCYDYIGEDVYRYYKALNNEPEYPFHADLDSIPENEYHRSFFYKEGILFSFAPNPISDESASVLSRFAGVFGQTYRRYLDLKKAEAQALEAIKQASLDRVRGQIASMRTTEDLQRITPLIWNELEILEVPFNRCGVFIIDEEEKMVRVYLTTPDAKPLGTLNLPIGANKMTSDTVEHWKRKAVFRQHWNKDDFINWTQSMMDLGQVNTQEEYQGDAAPPETLDLHFIPFAQGMLYVGNSEPLEEEKIELVESLAKAFSIAYSRYEDFRQLEEAKNKIETTLNDLKATQNQLIQSEKMASLGELTAGIAHEIQNPLNFVNNFSEVSNELIEEMNEELKQGEVEEAITIASDLKQNLDKINHHGKRADAIVKGMLQHSRASGGLKEPTDINVLADEYLRLAYHGLRAKDKSFNATMHTKFDETIGKISIVPQDMGRVLLNLITNAFYAVSDKKKTCTDDYNPSVTIITKREGEYIIISVKDNGNGISKNILDKIFQPFFTTKPTGQGTGLGLSMCYDIVTKGHGGDISVESTEGDATEFIITLPI